MYAHTANSVVANIFENGMNCEKFDGDEPISILSTPRKENKNRIYKFHE